MPKLQEKEKVYIIPYLNFVLFIIGMIIIWLATHNWYAMLGGFIASQHWEIKIRNQ